jgi:hypothetical protein
MKIETTAKAYLQNIVNVYYSTLDSRLKTIMSLEKEKRRLKKIKDPGSYVTGRIEYLESRLQQERDNYKEIKKEIPDIKLTEIITGLEKLKKNKFVVGIDSSKTRVRIYTKPLEVNKRPIGNYEIIYNFNDNFIKIHNLYKPRDGDLNHWFVDTNGTPCFGNWSNDLWNKLKTGELYLGLITIIQFLMTPYGSSHGYCLYSEFTRALKEKS